MSSGVTAACDSTVTVLLLSHVLPRFFLLFLFSFLKIKTGVSHTILIDFLQKTAISHTLSGYFS